MQEETVMANEGRKAALLQELSVHLLRKFGTSLGVRQQIGAELLRLADRSQITTEVNRVEAAIGSAYPGKLLEEHVLAQAVFAT